jgi:hypothetical protein
VHDTGTAGALEELSRFRREFYDCLAARADTLFELTDAVLCVDGPVTSLVELSLAAEHRRGHGALYDSLNQGRVDIDRFRNVVARQSIPRCDDGRIVLGIDVSNWLRPDAATSEDRLFSPHLRTRQGTSPDDSGMAVLVRGGVGTRAHVMDGDPGRPAPGT